MRLLSLSIITLSLNLSINIANANVYWGEKIPVGRGHAATFIKTYNGAPREIGIAISEAATTGLDPHMMKEYILPLPTSYHVVPYKHVTLDWNPHGHEPDGVYNLPHFDMHFYFITNAQRQAITCQGADAAVCTKPVPAEYIADHYAPGPTGVPKMGWHFVDLLAPEFNGGIFSRTYIYGYYNGQMTFIEPMITLASLLTKETTIKEIRQPLRFPNENGYYPETYKVFYDSKDKYYKIVLKDFPK